MSPKKSEIGNPRARRFVNGLIKGKSMRSAAVDAGYPQSVADKAGEKIFPSVAKEFRKALHDQIPIGKIAKRLAEGLDASETKLAQHEGKFTDARKLTNWQERRAYAELIARILGLYEEERAITQTEITVEAKIGAGDLIGAIRVVYGLASAAEGSTVTARAVPVRAELDRGSEPAEDRR